MAAAQYDQYITGLQMKKENGEDADQEKLKKMLEGCVMVVKKEFCDAAQTEEEGV
jgi:hypothetical protein